jgi:hypothetical protein
MNLEEIARRRYEIDSEADLARVTAALASRARALYGDIPPDAELIPLPAVPDVPYREAPEADYSQDVAMFLQPPDVELLLRAGVTRDDQVARLDLALLEDPNGPMIEYTTIVRLRQAATLAQLRATLTEKGRETFADHLAEFARGGIRPADLPFLDARLAEALPRAPELDDVGTLEPGAPAWYARGAVADIESLSSRRDDVGSERRDAEVWTIGGIPARTGPSSRHDEGRCGTLCHASRRALRVSHARARRLPHANGHGHECSWHARGASRDGGTARLGRNARLAVEGGPRGGERVSAS